MPGTSFGRGVHVVPSVEKDGASPFAGTARWMLTGAPKRAAAGVVGVSVTTDVAGNEPFVQVAVALPSPEPTDPAGGWTGGGGGGAAALVTTAPSTKLESMLMVTPPHVSLWPPLYWWTRWWFAQRPSLTYGSPKTDSMPCQFAIQIASGIEDPSAATSRTVEAALP